MQNISDSVKKRLKPGSLLIFQKSKNDPLGAFIVNSQRITQVSHASIIYSIDDKTGKIMLATTSGESMGRFGIKDMTDEVAGRSFYVAEYENLTQDSLNEMKLVLASYIGQWYGLHKVAWLILKSNFPLTGEPTRLWPWLTPVNKIVNPFCSESIAAAFWSVGLNLCQQYPDGTKWKEEPSAITPADLYLYACMKETPLNIVAHIENK